MTGGAANGGATNTGAVLAGVAARGAAAGEVAVARACAALTARAAAEFPDVTAVAGADAVVLRAPGLVARALGSRRRAPDPRLAGLVALAIAMGSDT
jgi:hypothetical protein